MAKKKQETDFAKSFSELEEIAAWFEKGEPDLDEGLKRYARASELATGLKKQLEQAENRIKEIKEKS